MGETFHVNNDMMAAIMETRDDDQVFAILEWCAEFEDNNNRPATIKDFIAEKPPLVYRGIYEQKRGKAK